MMNALSKLLIIPRDLNRGDVPVPYMPPMSSKGVKKFIDKLKRMLTS